VKQEQVTAAAGLLLELIDRQLEAFSNSNSSRGPGAGLGVLGGFTGRGAGDVLFGGWEGGARLLVTACVYAAILELYGGIGAFMGPGGTGSSGDFSGGDYSDSNGAAAAEADKEMFDSLEDQQQQQGLEDLSPDSSKSPLLRLALYQISLAAEAAPPDTLAPLAESVTRLLGEGHPVTKRLRQLAEKNMSLSARQAREMRQQQEQMAAATAVLRVSGKHRVSLLCQLLFQYDNI
jgi:hypothetical protein